MQKELNNDLTQKYLKLEKTMQNIKKRIKIFLQMNLDQNYTLKEVIDNWDKSYKNENVSSPQMNI